MRHVRRSPSLFACALSVALVAGCGDDPAGPDETDRTADRLAWLADSLSEAGQASGAIPLLMAADAVRAGAGPRSLTVTIDGESFTWTGIAVRMSLSEAACEQFGAQLPGGPVDIDFCAPSQFTVAWEGSMPDASRLLTFGGDTGAVRLGPDQFSGVFPGEDAPSFGFAMLHELRSEHLWMSDSGSAGTTQLSTGGECPGRHPRGGGADDVSCRLASYRVELGGRFQALDFRLVPGAGMADDPGPASAPRRITIGAQSLDGMHLEILRLRRP